MIVFKKSGAIRTMIDARQRNDNTLPEVMLLPDQEAVRNDVAHANFRMKIDLSDAFEQIPVKPEHEAHTVFATIYTAGQCNRATRTAHQHSRSL
jgi:hypothetical protein